MIFLNFRRSNFENEFFWGILYNFLVNIQLIEVCKLTNLNKFF